MKKITKKLVALVMLFAALLVIVAPITKVDATSYGDGTKVLHMDIVNTLSFTIDSVTINGDTWTGAADEFHTNGDEFHIVINVSGNSTTGEKVPRIQYGGNWNNDINASTQHNGNNHTFVLDVNSNTGQDFLGLEILEQNNEPNPDEPHFDGKAYVVWSCGSGVCYHYFDNIPHFDDGNSTFYKNTDITADNNSSVVFDVKAKYKDWILKEGFDRWVDAYKSKKGVSEIDWTTVKPDDIIGNPPDMRQWEDASIADGVCTKEGVSEEDFHACVDGYYAQHGDGLPFVKLQPVGEPTDNNAYVSYGDRNFKVVIYNNDFKGVTMGNLSDLHYYPESWTNSFIRQDQFDLSGTTKSKPTTINTILLESTVVIKTLDYNAFEITNIEALDVPEGAVTISKVDDEWKLIFSSNFYDNVVFKVTDSNNSVSYMQIKRYTIDGWIRFVDNHPVLTADFYFENTKSYTDFDLTAKILYKDGTEKKVSLQAAYGIDDGLGNITEAYEMNDGVGLKRSTFEYNLSDGEEKIIDKVYLNAEFKGSTETNYAGSFAGSGEGVLANIYNGGEE